MDGGQHLQNCVNDGQSHQKASKMKTDKEFNVFNGSQQAPKGKTEREKAAEPPIRAAHAKEAAGVHLR